MGTHRLNARELTGTALMGDLTPVLMEEMGRLSILAKSDDLGVLNLQFPRMLNILLNAKYSHLCSWPPSKDIFHHLLVLLDDSMAAFARASKRNGTANLSEFFSHIHALLNVVYEKQELMEEQLKVEFVHLKIAKTLLSTGHSLLAYEQARSILERMDLLPPYQTAVRSSFLKSEKCSCKLLSLVAGCWVSIFAAASELMTKNEKKFAAVLSFAINSLCEVKYWLRQSVKFKHYNSAMFRYGLRLLEHMTNEQVSLVLASIQEKWANIQILAEFTVYSCVESDGSDKLPYLIQNLAQILNYETFSAVCQTIDVRQLRSFAAQIWIDILEKLGTFGCTHSKCAHMIDVISFLADSLNFTPQEALTVRVILLRLIACGLNHFPSEELNIESFGADILTDDVCLATAEVRFWRCLHGFASEVCKHNEGVVSDEQMVKNIRRNKLLIRDVYILLNRAQTWLSDCSNGLVDCSCTTTSSAAHAAVTSLTMAYIMLWNSCKQVSDMEAQCSRQDLLHALRVCHYCVKENKILKIEEFLHKLAQKTSFNLKQYSHRVKTLLDVDCDLCSMIATSDPADNHLDKLSLRLIAYNTFCIEHGIEVGDIVSIIVTRILDCVDAPKIRSIFIFELIRCICSMPEKDLRTLSVLKLFGQRCEDIHWRLLSCEYYSAWSGVLYSQGCLKGQLFMESCLVHLLLNDVNTLGQSKDTQPIDDIYEMQFDCLLSLVQHQTSSAWSSDEHARRKTIAQEAVLHSMLSNQKYASCSIRFLLLSAKEIEIGAHILYNLAKRESDENSFEVFLHDFAVKFEDGFLSMRELLSKAERSQILESAQKHLLNAVVVLEATHQKLCCHEQFSTAERVSQLVKSVSGVELISRSLLCDIFLLVDPSHVPLCDVSNESNIYSYWKRHRSDWENEFYDDFVSACSLRSQGRPIKALYVINRCTERVRLALKLADSPLHYSSSLDLSHDDFLQRVPAGTCALAYDRVSVVYAMNFWHLTALYMQSTVLKALLCRALGLTDVSKYELEVCLNTCQALGLMNLRFMIEVQYECVAMDTSLDVAQSVSVYNAGEQLQHDVNPQSKVLRHAFGILVLYLGLAARPHDSSYALNTLEQCTAETFKMLEDLTELGKFDTIPWTDWCYRMLAKIMARQALHTNLVAAQSLIARSRRCLQETSRNSITEAAFVDLALCAVDIRQLCWLKGKSTTSCEFTILYDRTLKMIETFAHIQLPQFVKLAAMFRVSLAVIHEPLSTLGLAAAVHVVCSVVFEHRLAASYAIGSSITDLYATRDPGRSARKMCENFNSPHRKQTEVEHANRPQHDLICSPSKYPLVTICDISSNSLTYHLGAQGTILLVRSSALQDEIPIEVTLPWAHLDTDSGVLSPVQELQNILAARPGLHYASGMKREEKVAWWEHRIAQDSRLGKLLKSVRCNTLGCWWFLLLGEPEANVVSSAVRVADRVLRRLRKLAYLHSKDVVHFAAHAIRLSLQSAEHMSTDELVAVMQGLLKSQRTVNVEAKTKLEDPASHKMYYQEIRNLVRDIKQLSVSLVLSKFHSMKSRGPVSLLFDGEVNEIPWESLPQLEKQHFYRIPCVSYTEKNLNERGSKMFEGSSLTVDSSEVYAVLNPTGDLLHTENALLPVLNKHGWSVRHGIPPVDMLESLQTYGICLYFGHGADRKSVV